MRIPILLLLLTIAGASAARAETLQLTCTATDASTNKTHSFELNCNLSVRECVANGDKAGYTFGAMIEDGKLVNSGRDNDSIVVVEVDLATGDGLYVGKDLTSEDWTCVKR